MGTRSGDLDPAIPFYLAREAGMDLERLDRLLNRESGLAGLYGDNDMRAIAEAAGRGEERALLALSVFAYRIRKYIGAYLAALGELDCLVFTGGIGENSAMVREMACQGLERLGIVIDRHKNEAAAAGVRAIGTDGASVAVLVVPTDEELEIARQTVKVLGLDES